jgi:signal transduction histidine kinase
VVQKVRQAAEFLTTAGTPGLAEFSVKNGRWVWKDTYVWVLRCDQMTDAAHPFNPKLVGMNLAGLKDAKGNYLFIQLCEKANEPKGAWVEYWWPKVGEKQVSRKISYVLAVSNQPYQVAAGIYDDGITMEELNKLLK